MRFSEGKPVQSVIARFTLQGIREVEPQSTAVEVPWGYYIAGQGEKVLVRAMTESLASCIAYFFYDPPNRNFLFAHVSTDGEACSVVNFVKELTKGVYSGQSVFMCIAGKSPSDSTLCRINHIIKNIGQAHACLVSDIGGVCVDLDAHTVVKTKGVKAKNVSISSRQKIDAMNKDEALPLLPIKTSYSWLASGIGSCPAIIRGRTERARSQ